MRLTRLLSRQNKVIKREVRKHIYIINYMKCFIIYLTIFELEGNLIKLKLRIGVHFYNGSLTKHGYKSEKSARNC